MNRKIRKCLNIIVLLSGMVLLNLVCLGDASAYIHQIDISLSGAGGELTDPVEKFDVSYGTFDFSYTRYFRALEAGNSPLALREFIQHPSRIIIGMGSRGSKVEAQTRVFTDEESIGAFRVGGVHYLDKGPDAIGLGLELMSRGGEREQWDAGVLTRKDDTEKGSLELKFFKYLDGNARFELGLLSEEYREEDMSGMVTEEYEQGTLSIGVSALHENIWFSGHIAGGSRDMVASPRKQDVGHIDLMFGYYFNSRFGLLVEIAGDSVEEGALKEDAGTFAITCDYYFRDYIHIAASLISSTVEETMPGSTTEASASGIRLAMGVLF